MFTQSNGKPIDPRTDHDAWKALLAEADVRDARHSAATVLLLLRTATRRSGVHGLIQLEVAERYMHATKSMRQDVAGRLDGFLWAPE